MSRREFLNNLYRRLGNLSQEQAEQYLTYYAEMLADRMEEGMSEEEAVASMEDVETIAQRITQDEGVAPAYPDMFPTSGAADKEEPLPQPRRSWRKPAQIALWAAAIIAVVFAVGKQLSGGGRNVYETTAVDYATEEALPDFDSGEWSWAEDEIEIDGFHIGSDGIWYSEEDETFYMGPDGIRYSGEDGSFYMGPDGIQLDDTPVAQAYANTGALCEVDADAVRSGIDVSWKTGGQVEVQSWTRETIQFQEDSDGNGTLRYDTGSGSLEITGGGKNTRLKLLIPEGLIDRLEITGGADVFLMDLSLSELSVNSTSGSVACSEVYTGLLEVRTTSGSILLSDTSASSHARITTTSGEIVLNDVGGEGEAELSTSSGDVTGTTFLNTCAVNTTSGDIRLFPDNFYTLSLATTSGDVELALPNNPFCLEYNTNSGDLDNRAFPLTRQGSVYSYGGGGEQYICVNTSSGDLTLTEQ